MDTLSPESQTQQNQKPKRKYLRFALGFLGIIVIIGGGFFVWERYLSPQAKSNRETQKNYEKYLAWEKNYKKTMTEDTYGGKTPEETLQMFIEALKKEDIELAGKYFILKENGQPDPKWKEGLIKTKEAGKLQEVINLLSRAKSDIKAISSENDFKFSTYENNKLRAYVNLEFNEESSVWKIESM